jgi:hypothetical protein
MQSRTRSIFATCVLVALGVAAWWCLERNSPPELEGETGEISTQSSTQLTRGAPVAPTEDQRSEIDPGVVAPVSAVQPGASPFREVRLLVTDSDLVPLQAVRVECSSGALSGVSTTNERGETRVRADFEYADLQLNVSHEGFARVDANFEYAPRIAITLRRSMALCGSVIDASTRAPVAGARVIAKLPNCKDCEVSAISGAD